MTIEIKPSMAWPAGPEEAVGPIGAGPDQKLSSNIYVDDDFSVSTLIKANPF